jgi:hypothetical protein
MTLKTRSRRIAFLVTAVAVGVLVACASDHGSWSKAQKADTVAAYQEYLNAYPGGEFATQARTRVDELELATAEAAGTIAALEAFVAGHPDSPVLGRADERLAQLRFAEAEKAGTAEAWAAFLAKHAEGELAAKARAKRSELLFKFRTEVKPRHRVRELSGFLGTWSVKDPEKHVGLVFRIAFDFMVAGGELATHELDLSYASGDTTAMTPCSGITFGDASGDGDGAWVFNDLDAGQSFSMNISDVGRQEHSIVFAVPNDARDLVLRYRGVPLTGTFQLAEFPEPAP